MFIFREDNNYAIYLGVKHMLTELLSITTQSWDYLVYLHNLAVHKDHLFTSP